MTNITKIKNAIKRKVNESRVRTVVSSILDDSLPNILAEVDQLDQAFLDAKPVKEGGTPLQNKVYDAVTGMSVNGKDSFESKFAVKPGKLNDFVFKLSDRDATGILKLIKQRKFESIKELDVRKTHGDKRIENPATGNDIKLRTALKAKKGSAVYAKGKAMYNTLKDQPANEGKFTESVLRGQLAGDSALDMADLLRRYGVKKILKQPNSRVTYFHLNNASQGTKIVAMLKKMFGIKAQIDNHMYAPSPAVRFDNDQIVESKLTEANFKPGDRFGGRDGDTEYKYKKYVAKAFDRINDEMFKFRHAMGIKQLTQKDSKLKNKVESMQQAIFNLQREMKKSGLTEVQAMNMDTVPYNTIMKMKPGSTIKMKDGKIRTKDKFGNWRADTDPNDIIANRDVIKHMKGMKGFNIGNGRVRIEGKLTEAFKKGDKVKYLGHPATITNVKDYNGKTYYSVSYNKGSGKTKASSILSTDGTITEAKKIKPHGLGYRMNVRRAKADFKKGENIAAVSKQGLGSFKIEDQNDFNKYHPLQWDFAYIVKESKLTEAKIKKGDVIKMDDGEIGVVNKVKGRVAYIKLPSMPGSFHPIEADRTTYKGKHKGKDLYSETKSAPAGHYFTKGGNVVKGRLSKAAKTKGATKSDPKDKQRSKVPPATQRNESAKDKFGAPPMNKWWTGSKESLMSAIYHAQRQLPPSNKAAYDKNWKNIVKQLQKKFPAPTAIYRKRLGEKFNG